MSAEKVTQLTSPKSAISDIIDELHSSRPRDFYEVVAQLGLTPEDVENTDFVAKSVQFHQQVEKAMAEALRGITTPAEFAEFAVNNLRSLIVVTFVRGLWMAPRLAASLALRKKNSSRENQ